MSSIPVRLSASLAARARKVARVEERSLTEQVEHWARLGELIEASISGPGARQLKIVSHDPELRDRLRAVDTKAGTHKAQKLIRGRGGVRYGVRADDSKVVAVRDGKGRPSRAR